MSRIREILYTAAGTLMLLIHNGELPSATKEDVLNASEGETSAAVEADWEPPVPAEGDWQPPADAAESAETEEGSL